MQTIMSAKRGSVLIFALVVLAFSLVSALSIAAVSVTEKKASLATEKSNRAFQVADTGLEEILYKIYKVNDVETSNPPKYATLAALAGALGSASCNNGEIKKNTNTGNYTLSFYFYDDTGKKIKFTNCSDVNPDWRTDVEDLKVEGASGNTTRAVEVGLSSLKLVTYDTNEVGKVYAPDILTVKKGDVVFFKNKNSGTMQITSASSICSNLSSSCGNVSQNSYCSYKFDTLGDCDYYTASDPSIKGTISVQ